MLVLINAGVAKLADALALGASGVIHGGSSPLPGTFDKLGVFCYFGFSGIWHSAEYKRKCPFYGYYKKENNPRRGGRRRD